MSLETIGLVKIAVVAALAFLSYRKTKKIVASRLQRHRNRSTFALKEVTQNKNNNNEKKEETELSTSDVSRRHFVVEDSHQVYQQHLAHSLYAQHDEFAGPQEDARSERSCIEDIMERESQLEEGEGLEEKMEQESDDLEQGLSGRLKGKSKIKKGRCYNFGAFVKEVVVGRGRRGIARRPSRRGRP